MGKVFFFALRTFDTHDVAHFVQRPVCAVKNEFPFLEVYLHTNEMRGREKFFAKDSTLSRKYSPVFKNYMKATRHNSKVNLNYPAI